MGNNLIGISGKIGSGKDTVGRIVQYLSTNPSGNQHHKNTITFKAFCEASWSSQRKDCNWQIKKFAYKLKQIVSILTGIPVEDLEKQEVKDKVLGKEWDRYLLKEHWINDEYAEHEQLTYFATSENMHNYINSMGHTDSTCSQVGKQSITIRQFLQELGTDAMRNVIHPNIHINALFADYIPKEIDKIGSLFYPKWLITDLRFKNELKAVKDRGGITIRVNRDFSKVIETDNGDGSITLSVHPELTKIRIHPSETALDNIEFDYTIDNNGSIEELIEKVKKILIKEKII